MFKDFRFHHIGYVTDSIAHTSAFYLDAGYQKTGNVTDEIQRVSICFLLKEGFPRIELIEPVDENSSVNKILKKNKTGRIKLQSSFLYSCRIRLKKIDIKVKINYHTTLENY